MKISSVVSKILSDKYVLYFVLFLAVINVIGYMIIGDLTAVIFFILVAYLISNFSKNMIIVMGASLLLTNVLMVGHRIKEGMTASSTEEKGKDTAEKTDKPAVTPKKVSEDSTVIHSSTSSTPIENNKAVVPAKDETVEPVPAKKDEGMNVMSNKKRSRIDYAATVEDAYDDLNNILGGDGIKRLTDDTQKLMGQQLQLAEAMKSMTPLLENAKSMLQGFDMKNLDGIAEFAKSFGSTK